MNIALKSSLVTLIFISSIFYACGQSLNDEARKQEFSEEDSIHLGNKTISSQALMKKLDSLYNKPRIEDGFSDVVTFEDSIRSLYQKLNPEKYGLDFKPFRFAIIGYYAMRQENKLGEKELVSIIDFTKSSCDKRFYTIDLSKPTIIFNTYVSHGRNTGEDLASDFSNTHSSYQSSLGFYITGKSYTGSKGYSMRLHGHEEGVNDNMYDRAIVMHDADYVSEKWIKRYGRLGRSQGCPALPKHISKKVIDTIKHKTVIFAYFDDQEYLNASNYLKIHELVEKWKKD
jgi:hypothetical protein